MQDIKTRKIKNSYLMTGELSGVFFQIMNFFGGTFSLRERILALLPGLFFLVFAKITKEKIGYGDGMVLWILGNFLDIGELWYLLQGAMLLLMIFSIILLCTKKAFENCRVPFLPFLWMSQTILWGVVYG